MSGSNNPSLYIHIPFCERKCPYCDFYSVPYREDAARAYIDIIRRKISGLEGIFSNIYVGGGTPTALSEPSLEMLMGGLSGLAARAAEFTVEANPESITAEKIKVLLRGGVDRLSIGLQSLNPGKLKILERIHTVKQAKNSLFLAKEQGVKNLNIDLMFGVYGETLSDWKRELEEAVLLPVEHISVYALSCERGTPFFQRFSGKMSGPAQEETAAKMYGWALEYLPRKGFCHYEISNFAKRGFACKHNLNYWQNGQYRGLGVSAVSYIDGARTKITSDLEKYLQHPGSGRDIVSFSEELSPEERARETAALNIRTKQGVSFSAFRQRTGVDFNRLYRRILPGLLQEGFIRYVEKGRKNIGVCLTRKGFLFADSVCAELM